MAMNRMYTKYPVRSPNHARGSMATAETLRWIALPATLWRLGQAWGASWDCQRWSLGDTATAVALRGDDAAVSKAKGSCAASSLLYLLHVSCLLQYVEFYSM